MNRMDKEGERRLLKALDKAADLTGSIGEPNEIIGKVAAEMRLSAPEICRVAEMYNKGRSVAFLKSASADKTTEFPLADSSFIIQKIYGMGKTAAEGSFVVERFTYESFKPMEKTAEAAAPRGVRPAPGSFNRRRVEAEEFEKAAAETLRKEAAGLRRAMEDKLAELALECESMPKRAAEQFARNMINAYGERGRLLVGEINRRSKARLDQSLRKTAHAVVFPLDKAHTLAAALNKLGDGYAKAAADHEAFVKTADQIPSPVGATYRTVGDLAKELSSLSQRGSGADKVDPETSLTSEFAPYLKALDARRDFFNTYQFDPVIKSYPLEHSLSLFNDLIRTTPSLARNPIWMRSVMRRILTQGGNVDPVELKDMLAASQTKALEMSKLVERMDSMQTQASMPRPRAKEE